ncbi:glycerophosphoryl diester phosphodiesterase [Planomicrobium stackebrandtii]|uniref:Glycerophosphoryl diester phosphodiesterase n=1 Tax=Planomicrobium stackebrandtii TaxID=253160 RepID=A0ABU0GWJ4_9BACL|nr:glycerophosphodiester phosphodiesterase family protein [Planomicrobium stackebrandtii]MDQ0429737.1 glycerophosphoryl diester phosphodiesterase [Planomicrobium stackebrandtii]
MSLNQQKLGWQLASYTDFLKALQEKQQLLTPVAHRGLWNPAPENSLPAVQHCIDHHIYLIELDMQVTKDGHIVLMHDTTVDRTTNGSGEVDELTLSEIKQLSLKELTGGPNAKNTNEKVPTLLEVLPMIKGKAMINADKAWKLRHELYELVEQHDLFDHFLLKSDRPVKQLAAFFDSNPRNMPYMHKLSDNNLHQLDLLLETISPTAIELLFYTEDDEVLSDAVIAKLKGHTNLWGNALDFAENARHSDSLSLLDPDKGWGWFIDRGISLVQTNYPLQFMAYAEKKMKINEPG